MCFWFGPEILQLVYKKRFFEILNGVRHSTAISYPSIENLFNGCQGHPPVCPPPGTAQRQPDRIKKGSNAQQFIQLTVVGDINAESG